MFYIQEGKKTYCAKFRLNVYMQEGSSSMVGNLSLSSMEYTIPMQQDTISLRRRSRPMNQQYTQHIKDEMENA